MKRKFLIVYVLVAFVMLCTNVYAVVTTELGLSINKTEILPGDEVIITVKLEKLSSAISSIEGYLNIDENVLESISPEMIVTNDKGEIDVTTRGTVSNSLSFKFNPSVTDADYDVLFNTSESATNGYDAWFVMDLDNDIDGNSDILKLKFKVKESVENITAEKVVRVEHVRAYSSEDGDKSEELNASIDIKVAAKPAPEPPVDENKDDKNTNTDDGNGSGNGNGSVQDENKNNNGGNGNGNGNGSGSDNGNNNGNGNGSGNGNGGSNNDGNKNENANKNINNTNKNTNNTVNNNKVANNTDGTLVGSSLPATGVKTVIIPLVIFMILAYISYTKYMNYKDV